MGCRNVATVHSLHFCVWALADALLQCVHCKPIDSASRAVTKKGHLVLYPQTHPFLAPFQIDSASGVAQSKMLCPARRYFLASFGLIRQARIDLQLSCQKWVQRPEKSNW